MNEKKEEKETLFKVAHIDENIPRELPREIIEILAESKNVKIERIVSRGHASEKDFWYDQERHEFVILLSGEARVGFEDGRSDAILKKGDYLIIPAHLKHRVISTHPDCDTIWLAVHYA
jgi:cupin 2 domain-containing protein